MSGKPTGAFYLAVVAVIVGLCGVAYYRFANPDANNKGKEASAAAPMDIDPDKLGGGGGGLMAEGDDAASITTVKKYKFVPSERLPAVKGTSAYKKMEDRTVRFALNVWAGWAPIIMANNGASPGKIWKDANGNDFKVELVLIDEPITMRDAYAAGEVHIGWATLDMVPLFMEGLVDRDGKPRDSRVMPRIFQQVDWSNGGDGIVVRDNIKTVADLRGKKIALAENSPSHYFLLNTLVSGNVQPSEVEFVFTPDAFQAAAAFRDQKDIAGVVTWAPDIYNLSDVKGNRMLVNTLTANKLIADVWFARADFANDHPEIIEGLVRGIFDAMEDLKAQQGKQKVAKLMANLFNLPPADAMGMLADAHSTNWAENSQFFTNQNNPTRFEAVWNQAYYLYSRIRTIRHRKVSFDQVMDFSVIEKLGKEEKYSSQKNEYQVAFAPRSTADITQNAEEILTNTVVIHFYPNSSDLYHKKDDSSDELYDPNVEFVLEEISRLVGQFGAARVIIEGHTDSSMKSRLPDDSLVKELSANRAAAVKAALVEKFELDPNRFNVAGIGWDRPADPADPLNNAKNRRVEVKVFAAEEE